MSTPPVDVEAVARVVARHLGATAVRDLTRLSGGASRETWAFDATGSDGVDLALVLRRDPPGRDAAPVDEPALLAEAERAGVPVPTVRFVLDGDDDLGHGFVMDRIDGETLGRRIVHDERFTAVRDGFAHRCGEILAAIHRMDVERASVGPATGRAPSVEDQVTGFERLLDGFDVARPVLELGLRWLREHHAPATEPTVVHGDFRVGNLIVGEDGIRSVLDWELAHLGDPAEDLGWLCVRSWRFGGPGRVGGCGEVADLLAGYRAGGGRSISEDEVRYWEVYGNVRWAVICVAQAFTHLHGHQRSVELAAIGRRVAEVEHDLVELLA